MKNREIKRRFDEIVDFSGVEKFIDTPVKHYSSGMFLRLAFAVAAHLEPDILLVDEVLAVGDLEFQKKCLNKMNDVAHQGRTVLFVSHNMGSIKELCQTAIVLKNGIVDFQGEVPQAIQHYTKSIVGLSENGDSTSSVYGFSGLEDSDADETPRLANTEPFRIATKLRLGTDLTHVGVHCYIEDTEGQQIVHSHETSFSLLTNGSHDVKATLPPMYLRPGIYTLYLKLVGESPDGRMVRYFTERLLVDMTDKTGNFSGKVKAIMLPPSTGR